MSYDKKKLLNCIYGFHKRMKVVYFKNGRQKKLFIIISKSVDKRKIIFIIKEQVLFKTYFPIYFNLKI